jgi:hypothetical protein
MFNKSLIVSISVVLLLFWGVAVRAGGAEKVDIYGLEVPIKHTVIYEKSASPVRKLLKNQAMTFSLSNISAGSYHIALNLRSGNVSGVDGKTFYGGYNFVIPKSSYSLLLNGRPVATHVCYRSAERIPETDKKEIVYVAWIFSNDAIALKSGDTLSIQCRKEGGFVSKVLLLDEPAWEAEQLRSSDLTHARSDMGWGASYDYPPVPRRYKLRSLTDVVKGLDLFASGYVKSYLNGNPFVDLVAQGKALGDKIKTYRAEPVTDSQATINKGYYLSRQWTDYFTRVEQTLGKAVPPVLAALRDRLDLSKHKLTLNENCAAGRDGIFSRQTARTYADGAEAELKKIAGPNDVDHLRILYTLTYADNAAEFVDAMTKCAAKPQTSVIFTDYAAVPLASKPAPSSASPRSTICLNGVWDFAVGTGADNPPKPGAWTRKQTVPHGEWTFAINKNNITDEKWCAGARGYWDWYESDVWYKTTVDVPADWTGKRVVLNFEEAMYFVEVFINGTLAGNYYNGLAPFEIDVTQHVVPGAGNTVMVFVVNSAKTTRPGTTYRGLTRPNLVPIRVEEVHPGGITGDVYLKASPKVRADDIYVRTWADKRIRAESTLKNPTEKTLELTISQVIRKDGKDLFTVGRRTVRVEEGKEKTVVLDNTFPDAQLWGPGKDYGRPENLYYLITQVSGPSGLIDEQYTEFGFRELTIKGPNFYLNGIKIPLQANSVFTRERDLPHRCHWYVNQLFNWFRETNNNLVRNHQGGMCPDFAQIGNRLGIMVEPEAPWWFIHAPSDIIDQRATDQRATVVKKNFLECLQNRAWEDPIWRKNCREYYVNLAKRYRNDPSVVLFSVENESMDEVKNQDTVYQFSRWVKEAAPHLIVDSHSNTSARDDRFEIANFHDYDVYVPRMEEWAKAAGPNHKPIIIGEFYNETFNGALMNGTKKEARAAEWAMAKWIGRAFKAYIQRLNATPMYLCPDAGYGAGMLYSNSDVRTMGPYGDLMEKKTFKSIFYPEWPSFSGRGTYKVEKYLMCPLSQNINYADSSHLAYTPTKVAEAVKKVYKTIHEGAARRQPELIVTVTDNKKPVEGISVFLVPAAGQATEPEGVRTDPKGTAWFILNEPGPYDIRINHAGKSAGRTIQLDSTLIVNRGGFDYVTRAAVDLAKPAEWTITPGKSEPLPQAKPAASAAEKKIADTLVQGKVSAGPDGFIRDWLVCGPFPSTGGRENAQKAGWNIDYLTPTGGEAGTVPQPGKSYRAEFKEDEHAYWENATIDIPWRRYVSPEDYIDLGKTFLREDVHGLDFAPVQFIIGYAACNLVSDKDQQVTFTIGSDDGYKIYLNHVLVAQNRVYRGAEKDNDKHSIRLRKGNNLLLLKVDQDIGGYGFYLRLLDSSGKPLVLPIANKPAPTPVLADGYIRRWLLCGPFPNPGRGLNEAVWNTDFLKSTGGEQKIHPAEGQSYEVNFVEDGSVMWSGGKTTVAWKPYSTDKPTIELSSAFTTPDIQGLEVSPVQNILGYAATYIFCDAPIACRMEIDTINGVKAWLNGQALVNKHVHRYNVDPASPNRMIFEAGNYYANVQLRQGTNTLLLKLDVDRGPFEFKVRFLGKKDIPIPNIKVNLCE